MILSLPASYAYCERLARRAASNFYPAFWLLPTSQRRGMCALYAFARIADDLSDAGQSIENKKANLILWRRGFDACLAGTHHHPIHPALLDTVKRFGIPREYLEAILAGVEMDLEPVRYATFADLRRYCHHVASAVGLACLHIWGYSGEAAKDYAEQAGIAFQLTNILRDLKEDAARGRVYLPQDELARFGYDESGLAQGKFDEAFRALMRFQVQRAREYYDAAEPLLGCLAPPGRAVFFLMARTYRTLLEEIERRDYDVFSARIRVRPWRKVWLAARTLPVRLGLWLS